MTTTTFEQFAAAATPNSVVPVIQRLFSDSETPLSVYEKLAANRPGSFLLESAEHGVFARYSFVGVSSRGFLSSPSDNQVRWGSATGESALPGDANLDTSSSLNALRQLQGAWRNAVAEPDVPPLVNGLVGVIGWNVIRELENLPSAPAADFAAPSLGMALIADLVVLDHKTNNLLLVSNVFIESDTDTHAAYDQALARIAEMRIGLTKPLPSLLAHLDLAAPLNYVERLPAGDFERSVEQAKDFVRKGDVFQVVLSQRFDIELHSKPIDVYRVLRTVNPSPYMYLLNFEDADGPYSVVGASPESLVQVQAGNVTTHPIAGSRPRGSSIESDNDLHDELVGDAKERAEHLMLVDLARNDLLRVCEPSSVTVTEFMQVHKYSHIMHLVSSVTGRLRSDRSSVDAFCATFPAGTLSGAPKPRALEIIDELEPANRGIYGGVVGYFDFSGNADLAIAIRTAFIRDGVARVQAGAGIVLDSNPVSERLETISKASAPLRAIAAANSLERVH